jgi:hypothetical protein
MSKFRQGLKLFRRLIASEPGTYDERRDSLLAGRPFRFADDASPRSRTIPSEWIEQAIKAGLPVTVENAIVDGPLNMKHETITAGVSKEKQLGRRFRGPILLHLQPQLGLWADDVSR